MGNEFKATFLALTETINPNGSFGWLIDPFKDLAKTFGNPTLTGEQFFNLCKAFDDAFVQNENATPDYYSEDC